MTRVGYGDPLGIPNARWGKGEGGATWLLYDDFTTAESAPLASPRTCEPGPGTLTITDTGSVLSIASGKIGYTNQTPAVASLGWLATTTQARGAGMAVLGSMGATGSLPGYPAWLGWWRNTNLNYTDGANIAEAFHSALGFVIPLNNASTGPRLQMTVAADADFSVAVSLRTAGAFYFGKQTAWTLIWVSGADTTANVYAGASPISAVGSASAHYNWFGVRQLPAPFDTDYGIATHNIASPVSATQYTATADAIYDITVVAPNPLAESAGIKYRVSDADNYWYAYFDSSGAFKLDSVVAGVATNRINTAGAITALATRTIRIICNGSLHDAYTLSSTTWTRRGSQINVSLNNTVTTIEPVAGAGWTLANLRSYPTTSAAYDAELDKA